MIQILNHILKYEVLFDTGRWDLRGMKITKHTAAQRHFTDMEYKKQLIKYASYDSSFYIIIL